MHSYKSKLKETRHWDYIPEDGDAVVSGDVRRGRRNIPPAANSTDVASRKVSPVGPVKAKHSEKSKEPVNKEAELKKSKGLGKGPVKEDLKKTNDSGKLPANDEEIKKKKKRKAGTGKGKENSEPSEKKKRLKLPSSSRNGAAKGEPPLNENVQEQQRPVVYGNDVGHYPFDGSPEDSFLTANFGDAIMGNTSSTSHPAQPLGQNAGFNSTMNTIATSTNNYSYCPGYNSSTSTMPNPVNMNGQTSVLTSTNVMEPMVSTTPREGMVSQPSLAAYSHTAADPQQTHPPRNPQPGCAPVWNGTSWIYQPTSTPDHPAQWQDIHHQQQPNHSLHSMDAKVDRMGTRDTRPDEGFNPPDLPIFGNRIISRKQMMQDMAKLGKFFGSK